MSNPPLPGFPTLEESPFTRESLLEGLSQARTIPPAEIGIATLYAAEIEADIIALVERARSDTLDEQEEWLLFRGIHILGGRRLTAAYRPFVTLLREASGDRLERFLGDAITISLNRILAGLFDGDIEPLLSLITDQVVGEFIRNSALGTFAFLTFEGLIDNAYAIGFLTRFEQEDRSPPGSLVWYGWMLATGILGLEQLSPRVVAAFADERIPDWVANEKDYREILAAALSRPGDPARFEHENFGYINDITETLEFFAYKEQEPAFDEKPEELEESLEDAPPRDWFADFVPYRNPHRDVGRNDPCPCGSGKKFKKCCGG